MLLAGVLYIGSGIGLTLVRTIRDRRFKVTLLQREEWPWLLGAILFGGVLGPVALMFGLTSTIGSTASLLRNLEAVLTAVLAWVAFKENSDRRVISGMVSIVASGVVLSWTPNTEGDSSWLGQLAIALACLCWAIDNNLTRKVSAADALFIAGTKGLIAGGVNGALAMLFGAVFPHGVVLVSTMLVGLLGSGLSLVMFVLALRGLGTARTGAYFSTAPAVQPPAVVNGRFRR